MSYNLLDHPNSLSYFSAWVSYKPSLQINITWDCSWKWTFWYLDFYQTVRNPKSMHVVIILQVFTFSPEFFIVGTQTIVNKNWVHEACMKLFSRRGIVWKTLRQKITTLPKFLDYPYFHRSPTRLGFAHTKLLGTEVSKHFH